MNLIIDNCTIYRMLDEETKETQRKLILNAFKSDNEEIAEIDQTVSNLKVHLIDALSQPELALEDISDILIELTLNEEDRRQASVDLVCIEARQRYLSGITTKEDMQKEIHDAMLDDYYHKTQVEYLCSLYSLLSTEPTEESLRNIHNLKESALLKKLHPHCSYPDN